MADERCEYNPSSPGLYSIRELSEQDYTKATDLNSSNELTGFSGNSVSTSGAVVGLDPSVTMDRYMSDTYNKHGISGNYWPEFDWHRFRLLSGMMAKESRKSSPVSSSDSKRITNEVSDATSPTNTHRRVARGAPMHLEVDTTAAEEVQRLTSRRVAPATNYKHPSESAPVVGISGGNMDICYPDEIGFQSTCSGVTPGVLSRRCTLTPAKMNKNKSPWSSVVNDTPRKPTVATNVGMLMDKAVVSRSRSATNSASTSTKMITENPSKVKPWSFMFGALSSGRNNSKYSNTSEHDDMNKELASNVKIPFTTNKSQSTTSNIPNFKRTSSNPNLPFSTLKQFTPSRPRSKIGLDNPILTVTASQFSAFDKSHMLSSEQFSGLGSRLTISPSWYTNYSRLDDGGTHRSTSRLTISPSQFTTNSYWSSRIPRPLSPTPSQFTDITKDHVWLLPNQSNNIRPSKGEAAKSHSFRSVALRHRRSGHHRLTWNDQLLGIPLQYDAGLRAQRYSQHSGNNKAVIRMPLIGTRSQQHNS